MRAQGFTLIEVLIASALLVFVLALCLVAVRTTALSMAVADASAVVQDNVRAAMDVMTKEIELAAKTTDSSLTPPLQALTIVTNPAEDSPVEVVFQIPTDGTAQNWSSPIRYRYICEDDNDNGLLEEDEDTDGDGTLMRRIVRIQDMNSDGDTQDLGEVTPVGGANDLSDVQFTLNANNSVLTMTLTASRRVKGLQGDPITTSVTSKVYLLN